MKLLLPPKSGIPNNSWSSNHVKYTAAHRNNGLVSKQWFSMIVWTPAVLSVLYACVLYFCICTCSVQLSMFHMERCSRNMLIVIVIIIIIVTMHTLIITSQLIHCDYLVSSSSLRNISNKRCCFTSSSLFIQSKNILIVGSLMSQQHASVSQGRICSDKFTCCHTEIEVADIFSISPSHSILTLAWPVPVLTL